jgi:hypothetical protein
VTVYLIGAREAFINDMCCDKEWSQATSVTPAPFSAELKRAWLVVEFIPDVCTCHN